MEIREQAPQHINSPEALEQLERSLQEDNLTSLYYKNIYGSPKHLIRINILN